MQMNANEDPQKATEKCACLVRGIIFTIMEMVHMASIHFIFNVI
jgi:hypothetical protein